MMFLIGVLPIALAGIFIIYSVTGSHRASVASIEENLINQKIEEVSSFVSDAADSLELRVGLSDINKDFRNDLSNQTFLLKGAINGNPAIVDASFIETSALLPNFGKETSRIIKDGNSTGGAAIFTRNAAGEEEILRDQRNLPQFAVAKGGAKYIGPVYFTADGPMVTIAAPVRPNNSDEVFSVLTAELSLSDMARIISKSKLGQAGYIYVADNTRRVVASGKDIGQSEDNTMVRSLLAPNAPRQLSARYSNYSGQEVAAYGKYIPGINLAVVAEWPVSDADSILDNLRYQVIAFALAALVGVILLSVLLANKIVRPIKALEEGTEVVAKGKFDEPVNIKTGDEIEDLGAAFNKMTEGLKQLQALKDEFVFIAAHELKTPVAAIKGYLSIINDDLAGPVSDKVKEFIVKVLNANSRLIRLVEDLLEVARADAGKIKIDVAPTDIAPVVEETIGELKPLSDEKSIRVTYEKLAGMPKTLADGGRVREVLVNIIGNSIKYIGTKPGGKTIDIYHELKDGALVTHIKDNGLGMSKEAQAKLFQKFYRVATKDTIGITGTGLGLFIVKQIIEKMNGSIWVESEEGQGSTFSFSLPLEN